MRLRQRFGAETWRSSQEKSEGRTQICGRQLASRPTLPQLVGKQ